MMRDPDVVRILAISGSLRRASSNSALVNAACRVAPVGVEVSTYTGLAGIPPFNPDVDAIEAPGAVSRFRAALDACDAVLICSPEYAHGVSGVLKNALDWVVGSGELIDKPIAVINASARATHADASLRETLTTMNARFVYEASIAVPVSGAAASAASILADPELAQLLRGALETFVSAIRDGDQAVL